MVQIKVSMIGSKIVGLDHVSDKTVSWTRPFIWWPKEEILAADKSQ
jgi:hypothetical protein